MKKRLSNFFLITGILFIVISIFNVWKVSYEQKKYMKVVTTTKDEFIDSKDE